jgi:hypothetical protein
MAHIAPLPVLSGNEMNSQSQYQVMSGRRVVATRSGLSAREVALEYARSLGYKRDEIIYYGVDGVVWRGAVYRAELAEPRPSPPPDRVDGLSLPPVSPA